MTGEHRRCARRGLWPSVGVAAVGICAATLTSGGASEAQAAGVSGEAYGHYTSVGLAGAPEGVVGPAPRVVLPPTGSDGPITDREPDGATAISGRRSFFGGRGPIGEGTAPASGPIVVSTSGTPGPGGSVSSTASITMHPTPVPVTCDGQPPETKSCTSPGGFGPEVPSEGDELHVTCTANEQGTVGSTRIVNGVLSTSTDELGAARDREPIPEYPPPNYTRTGEITDVGDRWRIVYNEQVVDPDGSITVNGLHLYLLGDVAVGDQILGHVRCSMKAAEGSATTAVGGATTKMPSGPITAAPGPSVRDARGDVMPVVLAGAGLAVGLVVLFLVTRRRHATADGEIGDDV